VSSSYPLISVIMPVYNTEEFLGEAIDSILRQTYTHWELLLVDDGSTDRSGSICDRYVQQDARISVVHMEHSGLAPARNIGLQNTSGEWVFFLDSDDWLEDNALEVLLQDSDEADVVSGAYPTNILPPWKKVQEKMIFPLGNMSKAELSEYFFHRAHFVVWNKLWRRASLGAAFDENLSICADTCFNLAQLPFLKRVVLLPVYIYHYRLGHASDTSRFRVNMVGEIRHLFMMLHRWFAECEEVMEVASRGYVRDLKTYFSFCVQDQSISEANKKFLISIWLEDDGFNGDFVRTKLLQSEDSALWELVKQKDVEGIWRLLSSNHESQMQQDFSE